MESENYQMRLNEKIIEVCKKILNEEIGIIAGSRQLVSLFSQMNDSDNFDFMLFRVIESETDHLPVGSERKNWNDEALKRKDIEISEYELARKHEVMLACQNLILLFSEKD